MSDAERHRSTPSRRGAAPRVAPDGVFLIHGLGGTQYDLGSMHKRLKNAGFVTHSLTLPGHGTNRRTSPASPPRTGSTRSSRSIARCATSIRRCTDGHVHGRAARRGARAAREARQGQPRAARAAGVHRRLGHAVVSRPAPAAVLRARRCGTRDEDRGGRSVRHQERAAARDREGQVRARRELPLSLGAARVPPPGRPPARDRDEGARRRSAARRSSCTRARTSSRACARRISWSRRSAAGARAWSCSRTATT